MAVISNENLPTVAATGFVLALIGLAVASFNTIKINETATAVAAFEINDANQEKGDKAALEARIKTLEGRIAELEARAAAPAPPTQDATADAADPADAAE